VSVHANAQKHVLEDTDNAFLAMHSQRASSGCDDQHGFMAGFAAEGS
jgi:hypothetical protein